MNKVFKGMRKLPVTAIVMETFYKLNSYFVKKREIVANMEMNNRIWADKVMEKMEHRTNKAHTHLVTPFNVENGVYEVITGTFGTKRGGKRVEVNFNEGNCSCQKPMLYHYPCSHLVAVCMSRGVCPEYFIHQHYSLDHLKRTYEASFYPIKDREEWVERKKVYNGMLVLPKKLIRKNVRGTSKRGRRQEAHFHNSMDTMENADRRKHCSICGVVGHTKTKCPRRN